MTLHLAVKLSDRARRTTYEPALARHGTVHWCRSVAALESAVTEGSAAAMLELGHPDDAEVVDMLSSLRREHPTLLLIMLYDPAGEGLPEAARLAQRRLGLWFASWDDGELELLLTKAEAGGVPAAPTPAELAVPCVAELSLGPAARRFAWFCGLTPVDHLDEAAAAARCGEKLRTVQRQFADAGLTAGAVRQAFRTLHAAWWLRGDARNSGGIAGIFGRRSGRALREGVKDVLGTSLRELRRLEVDALGRDVVRRLRWVQAHKRARARPAGESRDGAHRYRVVSGISVTITGDTVVANLTSGTPWIPSKVTGLVLVEGMQGRSCRQILARIQRDFGLTRGRARVAADTAVKELSDRGVVELDND
jgi:hypothetical protein